MTQSQAPQLNRFESRLLHQLLAEYPSAVLEDAAVEKTGRRPSWKMIPRRGRLVLALAALVVLVGATIAGGTILSSPKPMTFIVSEKPSASVAAVPDEIATDYAIFRSQAADRPDASAPRDGAPRGVNPALARTVKVSFGEVTLVPGKDTLCLQLTDMDGSSGTCQPLEKAKDGALLMTSRGDGQERTEVVGAVPDSIDKVEAIEPDGSATPAHLDRNVWSIDKTNGNRVRFIGSDGATVATVKLP